MEKKDADMNKMRVLTPSEIDKVSGGFGPFLAAVGVALLGSATFHLDNIGSGIKKGWNSVR